VRAAQGTPDGELLSRLLADPYYELAPPKSTGREQFGEEIGRSIASRALANSLFADDIIATLTQLTATTIAHGIRRFASRSAPVDEVIVAGGGARNATLLRMLDAELPESHIRTSGEYGIPADAKEAICFAVLANEALSELSAGLPSVTGARVPVICGSIRLP
jgi:anhydro-N-acetylmuramic acid kinase